MRLAFHSPCGLGDHLLHCHYMRKLAAKYQEAEMTFYCRPEHWTQLHEVVQDVPAIRLAPLGHEPAGSIQVPLFGDDPRVAYGDKLDFIDCKLRQYEAVSRAFGLESPMQRPEDWLFDYPALRAARFNRFDFLVINAPPYSGQWSGYTEGAFDALLSVIASRGHSVVTTHPNRFAGPSTLESGRTVSHVGRLSQICKYIIAVSTGPSWTTFNVWNQEVRRLLLIDRERITHAKNTEHFATVGEAMHALRSLCIL